MGFELELQISARIKSLRMELLSTKKDLSTLLN